nr:protein phosphatase 1 regulatory subunit 3A like [Tanacetum cinerariifolium]
MATENVQASSTTAADSAAAPRHSCRKKRSGDASFVQDVRNHIDEFIHASMDVRKNYLK